VKGIPNAVGKQKAIVESPLYGKPRLIMGIAGSGKSVTVLNRVIRIKNQAPNDRILVITYNKSLRDHFQAQLEQEFGSSITITVNNYDSYIYNCLKNMTLIYNNYYEDYYCNNSTELLNPISLEIRKANKVNKLKAAWDKYRTINKHKTKDLNDVFNFSSSRIFFLSDLTRNFGSILRNTIAKNPNNRGYYRKDLQNFYIFFIRLIQREGLYTFDLFKDCVTKEFNNCLDVVDEIYSVYKEYLLYIESAGYYWDLDELLNAFSFMINELGLKGYNHILLDEAQDMSDTLVKSLNNLLLPNGSLLLFGDESQQIYENLTKDLVDVLEFSESPTILDENYRNKKEVALYMKAIQEMEPFPKNPFYKDIAIPTTSSEKPHHFEFSTTLKTQDPDIELKFLYEKIIIEGVKDSSIGIILKDWTYLRRVETFLDNQGFLNYIILNDNSNIVDYENKVVLTTMHSSKGLEFDYVLIPFQGLQDQYSYVRSQSDLVQEIILFYVSCSRAVNSLVLTYSNPARLLISTLDSTLYNKTVIDKEWTTQENNS